MLLCLYIFPRTCTLCYTLLLYCTTVIVSVGDPTMHSTYLYESTPRGPEDDSLGSKHVALLSHYMFSVTNVVFD
jgi:hypothetical protein